MNNSFIFPDKRHCSDRVCRQAIKKAKHKGVRITFKGIYDNPELFKLNLDRFIKTRNSIDSDKMGQR